MKIFLDEEDLTEIKPLDDSPDKGIIITPDKSNLGRPDKTEIRSDVIKEIIAEDVINYGAKEAALLHGVSLTSAKNYSNGKSIADPEVSARVIDRKHDIQNLALTKLMQTLNLLDPNEIDKEKDKVSVINGLSQVIERISEDGKNKEGSKTMHLHLYAPPQKKETDYDVIEA